MPEQTDSALVDSEGLLERNVALLQLLCQRLESLERLVEAQVLDGCLIRCQGVLQ